MARFTGKTCRLSVMLSLTFGFFLVELIFGYLTNSMALIADSFHMLSDVLALIIAFACMKISQKNASNKNTFGWVRAEVLGALVNGVFLIALCFSIFVEALKRIFEPEEIENPLNILIVGVLGLLVNIIGIFMFHGHASLHGHSHARPTSSDLQDEESANDRDVEDYNLMDDDGVKNLGLVAGAHNISVLLGNNEDERKLPSYRSKKKYPMVKNGGQMPKDKELLKTNHLSSMNEADSVDYTSPSSTSEGQLNMHGVFLHILGDAFGSVIVIVNALVCMYANNKDVAKYLDPSLSLAIALIITLTTVPLLKESAMILLQTVPTHLNVQDLKAKLIRKVDGVLAMHEFHVWRLAGNKIIATAHIRCKNLDEYMKIAEEVKDFFHREGIHSTTVQPEFVELAVASVVANDACVLACPKVSQCAPSMCCGGAKSVAGSAKSSSAMNPARSGTDLQSHFAESSAASTGVGSVLKASPVSSGASLSAGGGRLAKSVEHLVVAAPLPTNDEQRQHQQQHHHYSASEPNNSQNVQQSYVVTGPNNIAAAPRSNKTTPLNVNVIENQNYAIKLSPPSTTTITSPSPETKSTDNNS